MYLENENHNQNDFYQLRKTMLVEHRIMKDKNGGDAAVNLYTVLQSKVELSRVNGEKKGDKTYFNPARKDYFCRFSRANAEDELTMAPSTFQKRKAFLKKIGLIDYQEQKVKKAGVASEIYVTPWDKWVEQNGLYKNGEWVVEPKDQNYYNPANIVKAKPRFSNQVIEPTGEEIAEYESLMKQGKSLGVDFHKAKRMPDLAVIVLRNFGEGKKFTEATTQELPKIRAAVLEMEKQLEKAEEFPDF